MQKIDLTKGKVTKVLLATAIPIMENIQLRLMEMEEIREEKNFWQLELRQA